MELPLEEQLAKFDLFKGLSDSSLENLSSKLHEFHLSTGDVLFEKGDSGDAVFIVTSGELKVVSQNKEGNEVILNQVGPGAVIGEMSLLDSGDRSAGVVAMTEAVLLALNRKDFFEVVNSHPEMGLELTRNLVQRLRFATAYIENAIEWSQLIARGDYSFIEKLDKEEDLAGSGSDQERAARFLGAFFQMVEEIKAREEELKKELVRLKIEIDQTKRKKEVNEIAQSEFFKSIQERKKKEK